MNVAARGNQVTQDRSKHHHQSQPEFEKQLQILDLGIRLGFQCSNQRHTLFFNFLQRLLVL